MTIKFQNKYRIPSARLTNWNYANAACYFITICTQGREHYFGKIIDGQMHLSTIGEIVKMEWQKTFDLRPDMNLTMNEWIIMPNHFHAIIAIDNNKHNVQTPCLASQQPTSQTPSMASLPKSAPNKFAPQRKNLASIIRGFKSAVTMDYRKTT